MPATTKVPLGPSVLARRWYWDVNTGTHASPTWIGIFGIIDASAPFNPTLQPDPDYDSSGWKSSTVSALEWVGTLKLARKIQVLTPTAYDPGQEVLRAASQLMGTGNQVELRWYEMNPSGPKVEAYQGYAAVSWVDDGGAEDALGTCSVVLTGRGAATAITHPDGAAVAPVIYSIYPTGGPAAGGTVVRINGIGFFLAGVDNIVPTTGVKFNGGAGTASASWQTLSDNLILCTAPALAAGAKVVVVYNAVGISNATISYTYV